MKTPWWRKSNQSWTVTLPNGKQKTLGKDPHGEGRKNPPDHLVAKWHSLINEAGKGRRAQGTAADMRLSEVRDKYLAYLDHPGTRERSAQPSGNSSWNSRAIFS